MNKETSETYIQKKHDYHSYCKSSKIIITPNLKINNYFE